MTNNEEFRSLCVKHGVTRDVAMHILDIGLYTISSWAKQPDHRLHKTMPDDMLNKFKTVLAEGIKETDIVREPLEWDKLFIGVMK
jgi:hypothetical protein